MLKIKSSNPLHLCLMVWVSFLFIFFFSTDKGSSGSELVLLFKNILPVCIQAFSCVLVRTLVWQDMKLEMLWSHIVDIMTALRPAQPHQGNSMKNKRRNMLMQVVASQKKCSMFKHLWGQSFDFQYKLQHCFMPSFGGGCTSLFSWLHLLYIQCFSHKPIIFPFMRLV